MEKIKNLDSLYTDISRFFHENFHFHFVAQVKIKPSTF